MKKLNKYLAVLLFAVSVVSLGLLSACGDDDDGGTEICTETCTFSMDGDCDDGGPGADFSLCDLGTDCTDCGVRTN